MWPILFRWGPITLHTYGAFVAAGFLSGYLWLSLQARRSGLSQDVVTDFVWVLLLSGLLGARALYVLFNWSMFKLFPADIFKIWQGGLVWYGGLFFAAAVAAWWLKRRKMDFKLMADLCAPAAALGHAVGRVGCFMAGCCFGKVCSLPWSVTYKHSETLAPQQVPLHPSQIYESVLDFLLFVFLTWLLRRNKRWLGSGRLAVLYVGLYGLIRLVVEFTRGDDRGPVLAKFTTTQWLALATLLAAGAMGLRLFRGKTAPALPS